MAVHVYTSTLILRTTLRDAWAFLANPRNLARVTPPVLGFTVVNDLPDRIHLGLLIECRVRAPFGFRLRGVAEITKIEEEKCFVDEQRVGPHRSWYHAHHVRDLGNGQVELRDEVTYEPAFGLLGELAHPFFIAPRVRGIFAYRRKAIAEIFAGRGASDA